MDDTIKKMLKTLPKIDEILLILEKENVFDKAPRDFVVKTCRAVVGKMRETILTAPKKGEHSAFIPSAEKAANEVKEKIEGLRAYSLRRVVNATGIILHTNLGRAPLSEEALASVVTSSQNYCNLEYDLFLGERGRRAQGVEKLLCTLTGAESALVVNNNAGAVFLILTALAREREVIISRGELVQIGGGFRIQEILEQSGAYLREVGTTNQTYLEDYEAAINENTGLLLKVHQVTLG